MGRLKIIACDFDGTLCENKYPEIGAPRQDVIDALLKEQAAGAKLILWTCRTDAQIEEAISWCKARGIVFDAVNDNLPETLVWLKQNTRKIYATEYWDDRALKV